jgi:arylformamidase
MEFTAAATGGSAVEQAREALNGVLDQLRAAGGRGADLTGMTFTADRIAAFHPGRRDIDLVYREVLGGFRPPIRLEPGTGALVITARAEIPPDQATAPVWRGWTLAELERQMSPRSAAASMQAVFAEKRRQSAQFRASHPDGAYDLAYGSAAFETFDLVYPAGPAHRRALPLWVFIHGGYWQASDKSDVWCNTEQMLKAGYAVATPNYSLCGPATLSGIIEQMRCFLQFVHREAGSLGIDPGQIHIAGTSAGGHLAAYLACDPAVPFVRSSLVISGLHDLEPVALLPAGRVVGLDLDLARALSPNRLRPRSGVSVGIAVGELESEEFRRQSAELAQRWQAPLLMVSGRRHFDVTADLVDGGPLAELALRVVQGAS